MTPPDPPLPPLELAHRVGSLPDGADPLELYDRIGRDTHDQLLRMLPQEWSLAGRRALDFGCGAGRTLRHFLAEAEDAEIWGCDIDAASVEWAERTLCPPFQVFRCEPEPPLARPDGYFDLIWAISVFTHLSESWSRWLVDLHRVLADDGLLIVTYMGAALSEPLGAGRWDPDRVGMNVLFEWQDWDLGGPFVFHSDWWVREHWGRAFEIVDVDEQPAVAGELSDHSWALLRKRAVAITPEELERPGSDGPREWAAMRHNLSQVQAEAGRLASERTQLREAVRGLERRNEELETGIAGYRELVDEYQSSLSWRVTRPLRAAGRMIGSRRGRRGG